MLFKDEGGRDSEAQIMAFEDSWHWGPSAAQTLHGLLIDAPPQVSDAMRAMHRLVGENQMLAYLVMMAARLVELHRVLKPTGSLYLHCDPTASHYLKIILDAIFGLENFRNEVIWQRTAVKGDVHRKYGAVHDAILMYVKGENYFFQPVYAESDDEYRARFKFDDGDGRGPYQSAPLDSPNPRPNLTYEYKGYKPPTKGWRVSREVMERLDAEGRLIFPESLERRIRRKVYLSEQQGPKVSDVWTDITPLQAVSAERLGYPTQKPLALLERIIQASSNPGDVVLDPFAGCGTAIAAAHKLDRRWIGIDITHLGVTLMKYRLSDMFGLKQGQDYHVIGEPVSLDGAHQLAQDDTFQFQFWALGLVQARPFGAPAGSRQGKRGADRGVDGIITIMEAGNKAKDVIVQVKSGKVSSRDIRDLVGTIDREKAAIGVLITLQDPTRDMIGEAASAGFYTSLAWGQDYPRIQILTIKDLLGWKQINMPPSVAPFKRAQRVERPESHNLELFSDLDD